MSNQEHEEEEQMLRQAKALRRKAHGRREQRLKDTRIREAAAERISKAYEEGQKKIRRDEEIRKMLLPLAESMMRSGWRIKLSTSHSFVRGSLPLFQMYKSNSYPMEYVDITWKSGLTQNGFYWE